MSGPPPLPPPEGPPAPPPVRAESLWEFHADERVVEAGIGSDGRVRLVDALGTFTVLDAQGRPLLARRSELTVRAAALLPSGAAVIVTETERLVGLDENGEPRFDVPLQGALCVGASARVIAVGAERHPVRVLSAAGRPRSQCVVHHPVAHVAPCSADGHVVALSSSGQFSVVHGEQLLWRLHLRSNATALAATDAGLFAIAHRDGAQAFTIDGACLGIYDVGRPIRGLALAAEAGALLLLDDADGLHLVDLGTGYSTWRETRTRRQSLVRLSRDGRRGLGVARAGAVEVLGFTRGGDRAERLEIIGRSAPAGDGIWRHVTAVVEGVEPSCRMAVDPAGTSVALTRDRGERVEIVDADGGVVARVRGLRDLGALAFSADGARLVLHGHHGVASCRRDGSDRIDVPGAFSHAVPGAGTALVLVATGPTRVRIQSGPATIGECALPSPVVHALCTPDLSSVVVADAAGCLTAWATGAAPWRRAHAARAGSLALGGPGLVACEGDAIVGLRRDGTEVFRRPAPAPLELVTVGDEVYGRESANRFHRIASDGAITPVDARPNLGRSLLARLHAPGGPELLEINVNGSVLTAFRADGRIAWRCEAPAPVAPTDVIARGGLVVFRAATEVCLLPLAPAAGSSDVAGRAAFLEL